MKRLFLLIWLLVIGCSNPMMSEDECECEFEITSSTLPLVNGVYQLEFNYNLQQTYSVLDIRTECGWAQHISWESKEIYQIGYDWINLVNSSSMTDEDGNAHIVFAVWEEFIDSTITIYGSYIDDHGHTKMDSVKVYVVDN